MYKKMRLVSEVISGGSAILDFGCGEGELLARVASRFVSMVGFDASDEALALTRKKLFGNAGLSLHKYGDVMPPVKGPFDWITCLDVLEHLQNPDFVLNELYGLMTVGGSLVVTVPNWYDIINSKLLGRNKFHVQAHFSWQWIGLIKKAGFEVTFCRAVDFPVIHSKFLACHLSTFGMCIFILAKKI